MNTALILHILLGATAITDVRVEVGDGTARDSVTVVFDAGGIISVGTNAPPAGAEIIDGRGKVLTPGFIETMSTMGMAEVDMVPASVDLSSSNGPAPAFRPSLAYNPRSVRVPLSRTGGVTSALTVPEGVLIHGLADWVDLRSSFAALPGPKAPPAAMVGSLSGNVGGFSSRAEQWLHLEELFADARFYKANKSAVQRGEARPLSASPIHLEALGDVIDRRIPLLLTVHRARDILAAIRFAQSQNIRLVVAGDEAWQLASDLAAAKIPVVVNPVHNDPRSFEQLHARRDQAALLHRAGVEVIITAKSWAHNLRRLRQEAGTAVANGFPREAALAAITSVPARVFNRPDLGLVAPGKRADLVLWSGDPLELSSRPLAMYIAGEGQSLEHRQLELARRYARRHQLPITAPAQRDGGAPGETP